MTAELLDVRTPRAVQFVLAWLLPIGPSPDAFGITRAEGAPLPFRMVNLIYSTDDENEGYSRARVSVHTFAESVDGVDADTMASREADTTHRRMLYLARYPSTDVQMLDGSLANCEFVETVEEPAWRNYQDNAISRFKAVYDVGLPLVAF